MFPLIIIALILLISVIYYYENQKINIYQEMLDGYWEAPDTFCAKSGIKSAQLYFNDDTVYILLTGDDGILINKCIELDKSINIINNLSSDYVEYDIEFSENVDPLPQEATMRLYIKNGLLGIFVDDTLFLELFKNNKASAGVV